MATKYQILRDKMSPEARAAADALAQELRAEMPLYELREALKSTQDEMAKILGASQPHVSKLERQTDMYISTLRKYVEAMGGELELNVKLPSGTVQITHLIHAAQQ